MADFIIDDSTNNDVLYPKGFARGHDPAQRVRLFGAPPAEIKLILRSEWDARIKEQEDLQSSLEHIRLRAGPGGGPIPSLDQNGQGYCWAYSTGMAIMLNRAKANMAYVRLSPHAVACKMKNFRDEGGWCGLSAQFASDPNGGYPSEEFWPQKSMSRSNDNAATWTNAKTHLVTEDWWDAGAAAYDRNLTVDQLATLLLLNIPCAIDYDEWGHSICALRWVRIEAGSYGPKILNSWTDQWGDRGMAVMQKSWTVDGAIGIGNTKASTA